MAETIANVAAVALFGMAFAGAAMAAVLANRMEENRRAALRPIPVEARARGGK